MGTSNDMLTNLIQFHSQFN